MSVALDNRDAETDRADASAPGIKLSVNPAVEAAQITVSGTATGAQPAPNGVSIDFLPPGGAASVRLVTNLAASPVNGAFTWTGAVPGYATIPAGSQLKVSTNRQVAQIIPAPAFG
jgi:hypothetical protein